MNGTSETLFTQKYGRRSWRDSAGCLSAGDSGWRFRMISEDFGRFRKISEDFGKFRKASKDCKLFPGDRELVFVNQISRLVH